jgi:hypothetical protein
MRTVNHLWVCSIAMATASSFLPAVARGQGATAMHASPASDPRPVVVHVHSDSPAVSLAQVQSALATELGGPVIAPDDPSAPRAPSSPSPTTTRSEER